MSMDDVHMGEPRYVQVAEMEDSEEVTELPAETDDTILLTTLQAQFPIAVGLKYRSPTGKAWRGVRMADGKLHAPPGGWTDVIYLVTVKTDGVKRKLDEAPSPVKERESKIVKSERGSESEPTKNDDLIVLGLSWKATEEDMRDHFSQFGEVALCEVKKEHETNRSKGFGFVRYVDNEVTKKVLRETHIICGRKCDVKIPNREPHSTKLFVGRLPNGITECEVREHFDEFGELTDVYIPKPPRGFGFITFKEGEDARDAQAANHVLKGNRLNVTSADPKGGDKGKGRSGNFQQQSGNFQQQSGNFQQQSGNFHPASTPLNKGMDPGNLQSAMGFPCGGVNLTDMMAVFNNAQQMAALLSQQQNNLSMNNSQESTPNMGNSQETQQKW